MTQNGIQMLMKAMGFDPQEVLAKAQQLEQVFMTFGNEVQSKVDGIDARMAHMEGMLAELLNSKQQAQSSIVPAGECSPELYAPVLIAAPDTTEENTPHGRYARN